ncbi:MAG: hypothetical protein KC646_17675 [Candidatus Cloacimonetes bacterium]|nr:hypothetical protein [Candidatus Cloacimonadota bacterium]
MSFSNLILQQVLFHHLIDEQKNMGCISEDDLLQMTYQRQHYLNAIQVKLRTSIPLNQTETVLIISQYFIDKSLDTPFHTIQQLEDFISTLKLQLPKSYEPLMDAIRRKFLLYNIQCFGHPYNNPADTKRIKFNIDSLSKMIRHCLIESDIDKIEHCNAKFDLLSQADKTISLCSMLTQFIVQWYPSLNISYDKRLGNIKENESHLMNEVAKYINSMKALCIKLQPYLPRLNPQHVRELQQHHRILLKSSVYRAIKFSMDTNSKGIVQQAISALPSQYKLDADFDPNSLNVIIPTIGDIILNSYDPNRQELLMECIAMALVQYGTITETEADYLECRLNLDLENMKATFKHQPFDVSFKFLGRLNEPNDYAIKLTLNDHLQ